MDDVAGIGYLNSGRCLIRTEKVFPTDSDQVPGVYFSPCTTDVSRRLSVIFISF